MPASIPAGTEVTLTFTPSAAPVPVELKVNDKIDIITHDDEGMRHMRRVKVAQLLPGSSFVKVIGVNMQGGYPKTYRLPKLPCPDIDRLPRRPESIGWVYFDTTAEADE